MTNDEFGDAALNEARIGGSLGLEGAKSSGLLVLLGIEISGHLIINRGASRTLSGRRACAWAIRAASIEGRR